MAFQETNGASATPTTRDRLSSLGDVAYSCGSCGYALNLRASNRNNINIGSKYGKAIKKGVVSFSSIDDTRFGHISQLRCLPYFSSKHSWGIFQKRTKLLCRKCGNFVGSAYDDGPILSTPNKVISKKYDIRISALQPSSDDSGNPLFT